MINWTYNEKDFKINENTNALIPEGDHRVVVSRVTIKTYSSGNEGFEIMLDVSGHSGKLWHRMCLSGKASCLERADVFYEYLSENGVYIQSTV